MTELPRRLSSLDASFLYLERPNSLLHVGALVRFDAGLTFDAFVADVERRLPLIPRYAQRVVTVPLNLGHPTWEQDQAFDVRNHVRRHVLEIGSDERTLTELAARLFATPLDRSRPLWELHFIEGFAGGTAMLAKTHHCMIDGASGVQLIDLLLDPTPTPRIIGDAALPLPSPVPSPFARTLEGLVATVRDQFDAGQRLWKAVTNPRSVFDDGRQTVAALTTAARTVLEGAPPTPFNGPLGLERSLAWATLSLNEVKAIRNRLGGTVNDVILTVIAGALRHYLRALDADVDAEELRVAVPVNVRTSKQRDELGNRVSMMVAPLPISILDPVERLRCVAASMDLLKETGQPAQVQRILGLTEIIPPVLQAPLARLQPSQLPVNTICTNVPGPRVIRYVVGHQVRLMAPLVPLGGNIGLGFAIMSYSDQLTIGITADSALVSDPWRVAAAIDESYEELWRATGLERVARDRRVGSALERRRKRERPPDIDAPTDVGLDEPPRDEPA